MKAKTNNGVARRNTGIAPRQQNVRYYPIEDQSGNMLMTTLVVGAAGVFGYFGWEYYKKMKGTGTAHTPDTSSSYLPSGDTGYKSKSNASGTTKHTAKKKAGKTATPPPPPDSSAGSYSYPESDSTSHSTSADSGTSSDFPLKKGSKNAKVKKMQQALISKYGSSILPKYGADGDFGSETAKALKKEGLPATISESAYNVIVGGGSSNTSSIAEGLHSAAQSDNFNTALSLLKKIDSKEGYEQVSTAFEDYRLGGVRQTLVNGMMDTFTNEDQKQQIRFEFLRMGLQYDGNKWSLSGFDGVSVVTKIPTTVWINATDTVKVPARMVLGNKVGRRLDFTLFENNGKYFLVKTAAIKHL